jgi:hypothetical protein
MIRMIRLWLVRRHIRRSESDLSWLKGFAPDYPRAAEIRELIPLVTQELEQLRRREAELAGRKNS